MSTELALIGNLPANLEGRVVDAKQQSLNGGIQVIVTFANGYQASVINHDYSYGTELAVMHKHRLVYDTSVTNDVEGWLTPERLEELLVAISELPERV